MEGNMGIEKILCYLFCLVLKNPEGFASATILFPEIPNYSSNPQTPVVCG